MSRIANGRRQRIGSMVGLGRLVTRKQMANHVLHLILLGRSLSHHGELYLARGVLTHGKAALGAGHERRPAGLARGEGGRDVLPEPDRLDAAAFWWWIFMRRSASGRDAGVATQP